MSTQYITPPIDLEDLICELNSAAIKFANNPKIITRVDGKNYVITGKVTSDVTDPNEPTAVFLELKPLEYRFVRDPEEEG